MDPNNSGSATLLEWIQNTEIHNFLLTVDEEEAAREAHVQEAVHGQLP